MYIGGGGGGEFLEALKDLCFPVIFCYILRSEKKLCYNAFRTNFNLHVVAPETEPLESPPFQIAGVGPDVTFRLALHKKEMHVACFLIVSCKHRAPMYLRIERTFLLKLPNEITKIAVKLLEMIYSSEKQHGLTEYFQGMI
ncbi:hypothetical protein TNCV_4028061 [Trichonephila clavipes]|nr:hypothetical protein TNCV_4028061 [Trichonephila clavipes]